METAMRQQDLFRLPWKPWNAGRIVGPKAPLKQRAPRVRRSPNGWPFAAPAPTTGCSRAADVGWNQEADFPNDRVGWREDAHSSVPPARRPDATRPAPPAIDRPRSPPIIGNMGRRASDCPGAITLPVASH